ncbi:hypothetical protein P3T27_000184 [Kitasatospora sp. MAA19]|uniref:hypothetical protein n=1 Tax=Kitasatospora sp. MAA19 TaxID=3035090 RepID=UPI002473796A|nr:hypothetical protein [Kitasatospora sp. MAA19]MDH6703503.1 hypothetical protein [Kitasatospora sp. MAA19]
MSRQFPRTAAALAVLAAGLLTGWNAPLSVAQQSPDAWSGEHRAVLPSGLSVQFEFAVSPGAGVTAEAGELADRAGGGAQQACTRTECTPETLRRPSASPRSVRRRTDPGAPSEHSG